MRRIAFILFAIALSLSHRAHATIFGSIEGIVHDPQHRPITDATVHVKSATSDVTLTAQTNQEGAFRIAAVPVGAYIVTIQQPGFSSLEQRITVASNTSPILHFELAIASVEQSASVTAERPTANVDSVTPTTLVDRRRFSARLEPHALTASR